MKTQAKARQILLTLVVSCLALMPTRSSAAVITWTSNTISTAAADVLTTGTLKVASVMGVNTAQTINTVVFAGDIHSANGSTTLAYGSGTTVTFSLPATFGNGGSFVNSALGGSGTTYNAGLNNRKYYDSSGTVTITLGGLTSGNIYKVQFWACFGTGQPATRTHTYNDGNGNTVTCKQSGDVGTGQFCTGTFTASGTSQTITVVNGASTGPAFDFSMFQLRDQGPSCVSPTAYGVTGGTNCDSATIGLANAETGVTYQIFTNGVSIGAAGSTNPVAPGAIDFGLFTAPATYTIRGTNNSGGCATAMSNNVVISASPVGGDATPTAASVCSGSGTTITLTGHTGNIQWQSRTGANEFADIGGATSTPLNTGNLTVDTDFRARLNSLGCVGALSTTGTVTVVSVPAAYAVTGGTNCSTSGVTVGLSSSVSGVTYQLFTNGVSTGAAGSQSGTDAALDFGLQTAVANYTVWATNGTGCGALMNQAAQVYALTANVTGGATIRKGTTALITNTFVGYGPFNVTWSDGVTSNGVSSPLVRMVSPAATTTYTITNLTDANCATASGFTGSAGLTVVGSAYKIRSAAGNASFSVAAAASTNITITLVNAGGTTETTFNGTVNLVFSGLAVSDGGNVPTIKGTNQGLTTPVTFVSGAATVPLVVYKFQTGATLSATDDGSPALSTATTGGDPAAVTVTGAPGTITKLVWTTQPGAAAYNSPFGTQPVLKTVDQNGNPSTNGLPATLMATVSLTGGTGPLLGTTNVNIGTAGSNGVVTFTDLEIPTAGTNKQLTATVPAGYGAPLSGMAVWLDGGDTNTIVGSNPVTSWNDKSGNGINYGTTLSVGTSGNIRSALNTVNGRNVIFFPGDGSGNGKALQGAYVNSGTSGTFFVVVRHTASSQGSFEGPMGATSGTLQDWNNNATFNFNINAGNANSSRNGDQSAGAAAPTTGVAFLMIHKSDGANRTTYFRKPGSAGGQSGTAGITTAFNITRASVGSRLGGANGTIGDTWKGDVCEVILYNSALSDANRLAVETYVSNKWFNAAFSNVNYSIAPSAAVSATFTVVSNSAPVAGDDHFTRGANITMKIAITALLANDTDPDPDTVQFVGTSATTTNGMTLANDATYIYLGANNVNDAFTYTIHDGNGGTNTGNVFITIVNVNGQAATTVTPTSTNATAVFFGIPGQSYTVQRATNVTFAGGVSNFPPMEAPSNGVFSVTDDFDDLGAVPDGAFYRLLVP